MRLAAPAVAALLLASSLAAAAEAVETGLLVTRLGAPRPGQPL